MQRQQSRGGNFLAAVGLVAIATALGVVLASGARAEMYAWRTDDGGYAYTDDVKRVPARYAARAQVVELQDLEDYERFTPQDDEASRNYATRLAERLNHLRAMNAPSAQIVPGAAAASVAPQRLISLSTGDPRAPEISVPVGQGAGPILIEPVLAKSAGDTRTRRVTVVRQGDETLAVIKGNPHVLNPIGDVHDEDALDAGEPLR